MKVRKWTRHARVGHRVRVSLRSPGATGYIWTVEPSADAGWRLIARGSKASTLFGGAGKDTLDIEVLRPGHATISAELKRPWERDAIERVEILVEAT